MADIERTSVSNALIDNYSPNVDGQDKPSKIAVENYYVWLQKMPEVSGVVGAICNDVMGDGFEFRGDSKAGVKAAQEFVKKNHFTKKLYSTLQDYVLLGDAYLGVRIIQESYINKMIEGSSIIDDLQKCDLQKDDLINKLKIRDPDLFFPREIFPLKATTIYPNYDEHGRIKEYIQKVNGNSKKVSFSPFEVIHFSLNNIGNDVFGSTPLASCLNDIATLWYAKDYAGTFFQNDATPDKIYVLKNTAPGSEEYEAFKKQIEKFKNSKNKHKSMVMTGEVEVQNVNEFNKDLEFATLIDKFTQRLRMAWNMPGSRLDDTGKSGTNKSAEAGYYKNINRMQAEIEETLNAELWSRFGDIEMVFKKAYKRDESIEADIVTKTVGKPVMTQNEGREYLGYKPLPDSKYDEIQEDFKENPGGQLPDTKEGEEVGNQHRLAEKMDKVDSKNLTVLDFNDFVTLVESDGRVFEKSNVYVDPSDDIYSFFFKDGGIVYETKVSKSAANNIVDFENKFVKNSVKVNSKPEEQLIVANNISSLVSSLGENNNKLDSVVKNFSEILLTKSKEDSEKFDKFMMALAKSNENVNSVIQEVAKIAVSKNNSEDEKLNRFISAIDKTNDKVVSITNELSKIVESKSVADSEHIKSVLKELNKTNGKLQNIVSEATKVGVVDSPKDVEKRGGANGVVVSMTSFNEFSHIVEADGRNFMTAKVFVDETPAGFDFCFADHVAMYECFVPMSEINDIKEFRLRFVNYSLKGKLK